MKHKESIRLHITILLVAALFTIWHIPHTIGVRNITGLFLFLILLPSLFQTEGVTKSYNAIMFWLPLGALTTWILSASIFLSLQPQKSISEFSGQWDTAIIFSIIGFMLALYEKQEKEDFLFKLIFFVLLFNVLYYDFEALKEWFYTGALSTRRNGLHDSPVLISYLIPIVMAFLLSTLYTGLKKQADSPLKIPISINLLLIAACSFATYLTRIRLGIIGIVGLLIAIAIALLLKGKPRYYILAIFLITCASAMAYAHYLDDRRWDDLKQTATSSLDINSNAWLDNISNPAMLDSNSARLSFISAGITLIERNPLGYGYDRNAFGHAFHDVYGFYPSSMQSHSGIINFTISNGLPATMIWLLFNLALLFRCAPLGLKNYNSSALMLTLVVTSTLYRSFVDETMRDHMLQMNLFLYAYLYFRVFDLRTK